MKNFFLMLAAVFLIHSKCLAIELYLTGSTYTCSNNTETYSFNTDDDNSEYFTITVTGGYISEYTTPSGATYLNQNLQIADMDASGRRLGYVKVVWNGGRGVVGNIRFQAQTPPPWYKPFQEYSQFTSLSVQLDPVSQPVPIAPNYNSCNGAPVSIAVGALPRTNSYSWYAPAGWNINNAGSSFTNVFNSSVTVTPPANIGPGTYAITVTRSTSCGLSPSATINITVINGPIPTPNPGSFYIMRYDGCRKYYGITAEAVIDGAPYTYTADVTLNGVAGPSAVGIYNQSTGRVSFPLDMETPYGGTQATGVITLTGPCGVTRSTSFTEYLSGIDPGCVDPGDGGGTMSRTSSPYPNPASESFTAPTGVEEATLFDGRGKQVRKASKLGKIDVRDLPEGLYNLRTVQKGKVVNQRIQVKH